MMERAWRGILARYGQEVRLYRGETAKKARAIIQPILDRGKEQQLPTPPGQGDQKRFLYLGPAEHFLDSETLVEWQGAQYRIQMAHLVGREACPHWWAVLYPRDEVAV